MSLQTLLSELSAGNAERTPEEVRAVMTDAANQLEKEGVGNDALKAGENFPDIMVRSATGESISSGSLFADGPVIFNFYRGGWCPYCNLELKAYQDILPDIQSLGGSLAAITPEKPDSSLSTAEKNNLAYPVLTDDGNMLAAALGIVFEMPENLVGVYKKFKLDLSERNAGTGWSLAIPAVYVVAKGGQIVLASVDRDYTHRLEPALALEAMRKTV